MQNSYNDLQAEDKHKIDKKKFDLLFLIWSIIRPIMIVVVCVLLVVALFYTSIDILLNKFLLPTDSNDTAPIQVVIDRNSSVGSITKKLESYELIKNATVFKYYIDISGYGNK